MAIIIIAGSVFWNACTTIGIRIPNVPHDVPVANASPHPTTNITAGRNIAKPSALFFIITSTNSAAPKLLVMFFNVHANVKIRIAGTIALNPSGRQSIHSLNGNILRTT